jgi:hypothetical protein
MPCHVITKLDRTVARCLREGASVFLERVRRDRTLVKTASGDVLGVIDADETPSGVWEVRSAMYEWDREPFVTIVRV